MGGPLQTGQVSSKSVRWLVPPLPGCIVDALLTAIAQQTNTPALGERKTADEENIMIDDINPKITTETTASDYPGQNTIETPPEEDVLTMKDDIVTRREEVKEQQLAERLQLPKINKDARVHDTIDIANLKPSMISK